jgi:hypothetical protein
LAPQAPHFFAAQAPHFLAAQAPHFLAAQAPHFFVPQADFFAAHELQPLTTLVQRDRQPVPAQPLTAAAVTTATAIVRANRCDKLDFEPFIENSNVINERIGQRIAS